MPQDTLFGDDELHDGLRLTMEDLGMVEGESAWRISIHTRTRRTKEWRILSTTVLTGIEADFVPTLLSECSAAWCWGTTADVIRVWQPIIRQAKQHRKAHRYMG